VNGALGWAAPACYVRSMATQSTKPPTARLSDSGATGHLIGGPRFLTSVQRAELRRKLADVDAKLRQMTWAEHERRR
jgi:hypothetical protein